MMSKQDAKTLSEAIELDLPTFTAKVRTWYIKKKLTDNGGNIASTAKAVGVTRWALYSAMKTLEIDVPEAKR